MAEIRTCTRYPATFPCRADGGTKDSVDCAFGGHQARLPNQRHRPARHRRANKCTRLLGEEVATDAAVLNLPPTSRWGLAAVHPAPHHHTTTHHPPPTTLRTAIKVHPPDPYRYLTHTPTPTRPSSLGAPMAGPRSPLPSFLPPRHHHGLIHLELYNSKNNDSTTPERAANIILA
ncbi:hypothetical protein EV356DRAFT_296810 [Viridothelium virens]|uniref:Uncharacterized protein n=1 Tax=Viridothelium virens TaxID=1048519 RepID=A0A6A6H1A2_VIRVR|nr:hypothetical protein EV356DRAFT_296810 [Viridothelium virens]